MKSLGKKAFGILAILVVILLVLNIFQFYYFNYMRSNVSEEDVPMQISDLKGASWQSFLGARVTVEGFFVQVRPGLLMLVSSLDYLEENTQIPIDKFVRITGNVSENLEAYSGSRVYIKGIVEQSTEKEDELVVLEYLSCKVVQAATRQWFESIVSVSIIPGLKFVRHYALLISGGIDSSSAYYRYWNDLKFMYSILVNHYSYDPRNIIVIYKNGVAEDAQMPVNYSATLSNVQTAFTQLAGKMTADDRFFLFTTNHGSASGLNLYYNQKVTQNQMATMLDSLTVSRIVVVMEQCFSGSFISQISGANRVILTACSSSEVSWSCDTEGSYNEFVYHFMSAVNFQTPTGTAVNADMNSDEKISMVEAFNYARSHDSRSESPYYDDSGDGIGHSATIPNGGDGTLGSNTFL